MKKGSSVFCKRNDVKYAFIKENSNQFSIKLMCKVLKVSRSCYYRWLNSEKQEDIELNNLIKNIFQTSNATYGQKNKKCSFTKIWGYCISQKDW
jgi:putative transposase